MNISIINTRCANLSSLKYAIMRLGYRVNITENKHEILGSNKIFLPGIGTSYSVMNVLNELNLVDVIKMCIQPILGICLGMQILCSYSDESKNVRMLDIIKLPVRILQSNNLPLPHNGWNDVIFCKKHPLFINIDNNSKFYFLHSYAICKNIYTISKTLYNVYFSSAIQMKNFFGVQFHPEKSGDVGAQLLKNFLEM
ncbi:MAG: imidazole glycerol phosphate synthase subunit HisH [Buchnera aphidicola (Chaetogeoica yunlongensis)]